MHQPMKSCGWTLPYLYSYPWDLQNKSNIFLSPLNLLSPPSPLSTNLFYRFRLKTLKNILNLTMIKPTQSQSSVQFSYHFWNHILPQTLFPMLNSLNSRQNYCMERDFCGKVHYFSHIPCMNHWWQWNDTPGYIKNQK